jgi:two-component system phosphate regulon response regulator PhoB
MAKTILVVVDDADLCGLLEYNLSRNGYRVEVINRLDNALAQVRSVAPDLILLDVMLPDGDGFELCRQVRADDKLARVPILFLSARGEEVDRVLGLEIGGDDYITKPFSPRELVARVKAHLRRQGSSAAGSKVVGPLEIDAGSRRAFVNGQEISLTATEFRILELFVTNPGKVFSRESLLETIWGRGCHVTPRNVDVHVRRLRERIEVTPDAPKWIQTVRGFGYRFEIPA